MDGCKELAGTSVSNEILKMQGGVEWDDFIETLRQIRLGKHTLTDTEFQSWNRDQKATYEEFKKLGRKNAKASKNSKGDN